MALNASVDLFLPQLEKNVGMKGLRKSQFLVFGRCRRLWFDTNAVIGRWQWL